MIEIFGRKMEIRMLKIEGYNKKNIKKPVFEHLWSILSEDPKLGTGDPVVGEIQPRVGPSEKCVFI